MENSNRMLSLLDLIRSGQGLSTVRVQELEVRCSSGFGTVEEHLQLFGYHYRDSSPDSVRSAERHILALYSLAPSLKVLTRPPCMSFLLNRPILVSQVASLLEARLRVPSVDVGLLDAAISFFLLVDEERARELLIGALQLDARPSWSRSLGGLLLRKSTKATGDESAALAREAAELFLAASHSVETTAAESRSSSVSRSPSVALDSMLRAQVLSGRMMAARALMHANDLRSAVDLAEEVLKGVQSDQVIPERDGLVHHAHQVLGLAALRLGQTEDAVIHLLASSEICESIEVSTTGPRMGLALALVIHGATESVILYLDRCAAFWERGRPLLSRWKGMIRAKEIPDFGSVLTGP